MGIEAVKGQLFSKAIYGLLTSPKKQMDEFALFSFLLFTANKSNSSVHFLGESTACQCAFQFYLTFTNNLSIILISFSGTLPAKQFVYDSKTQHSPVFTS